MFAHSQFVHVQDRVDIWLDPWADPKGDGFQIVEAQFAFSAGGRHRHRDQPRQPEPHPARRRPTSSSPPSVRSSGWSAPARCCIAYLLMIGAGLRIALRTEVPFERLLATGLTVLIGVQSFIIIAGVMRVLPLTGVTLPFVSYGGSSLIANYVLLALLLRISDDTDDPAGGRPRDPADPRPRASG